jgi:hypothetical protein
MYPILLVHLFITVDLEANSLLPLLLLSFVLRETSFSEFLIDLSSSKSSEDHQKE